jgi:dephospho-CoA kinase
MRAREFLVLENQLQEGVNDPAIFKVVFLIGGPGSGKSYVSKQLALSALGYTTINSDIAFEYLLKKNNLNPKMPPEEKSQRDIVRDRAKNITADKSMLAIQGRLGIVIDGTGDDFEKISKIKYNFDALGYTNFLVVVNTKLEVAKQRNLARFRTVPDEIVTKKWYGVQNNIGKFANIFENFAIIDNSGNKETTDEQITSTYKKLVKFTNQEPNKSGAKAWINLQKNKHWDDEELKEDSEQNKLVIFDIDDTLVHTQTKVHVVKNGKVTHSLNSHDFTHYKLKPGEEFDFGDFSNAREFFENAKPIIPMINQLKRDINTGNKVVMVTARSDFNDRELFLDTFRKYGVDMSKVHVYRAGNMTDKISTEEKKKIIINRLLDKEQYNKAIMYDDAVPNLNAFVSLKKEHPDTRFYAWHVDLDGNATEFERH